MIMPRKTRAADSIATISDLGQSMDTIMPNPKAAKYKPNLPEPLLYLLIKKHHHSFYYHTMAVF